MNELGIDQLARECIVSLVELVKQANHTAGENRGLIAEHKRLWEKITGALDSDTLLLQYAVLTDKEISFFDPQEAYLAGCEAKLDGVAKEEAYVAHIEAIKKENEYNDTRVALNSLFEQILHLLLTETLREDMYRLDVLHNMIYGAVKRKLYLFFNLGFDCCIVEPREMGLMKNA